MPNSPFTPQMLTDALMSFEGGMNQGVSPLLLQRNQMALAQNLTVRGTLAKPRPTVFGMALDFGGDSALETAFLSGKYQGGAFYNPDNGPETLMVSISGRIFEITPGATTATVKERTIPGDPNPDAPDMVWMWQSEKWMIVNDGISLPMFITDTTAVRSNYASPIPFSTTTTAAFLIPAIGANVAAAVGFTDVTNLLVGDIITVPNRGTFAVLVITPTIAPAGDVDLLNITATPLGQNIAVGTTVSWQHVGTQLPPGRMGAYGMGRNWVSLPDGKQFVASDLVGGSSGTVAENYRDAVLNITENLYLAGGGNFTVPGSLGAITAMRFVANLDASLGQGPLQVGTHDGFFSCNAPVDRLTWQDMTNPILTQSLISNGPLSQWATISANSDLMFRAVDGIRSLILARREFATWGNVPQSREVETILSTDAPNLLRFASAVVFDNRLLMTCRPATGTGGVYWRGLIALNFDPLSSLAGKSPSVYDGLWTGLNILQTIVGEFAGVERAFALTWNVASKQIELYEIRKDVGGIYDNDTVRIVQTFESSALDFGEKDPRTRHLKRLENGEIWIDDLQGTVDFQAYYKPDQWPCWVPWFAWQECATASGDPLKPGFRPSMGLGEPSSFPCDNTNDRPLRQAYTFQFKLVITGHCRFLGARFQASTQPEPQFAPMSCKPICET